MILYAASTSPPPVTVDCSADCTSEYEGIFAIAGLDLIAELKKASWKVPENKNKGPVQLSAAVDLPV